MRAGFAFLPLAVCVTVGSTVTGRVVRRFGVRATLAAGFGVAAAGLAWLEVMVHGSYITGLLPGLLVSGVGHGVIYAAMFILGSRDVLARQQGRRALITTAQYLAGAVMLAVLTLIPAWAAATRGSRSRSASPRPRPPPAPCWPSPDRAAVRTDAVA